MPAADEFQMTAIVTVALVLLFALLAGLIYQAAGSARGARLFPAPGTLIDIGGHRLHIQCAGHGSPTVLLESGIAASSLSWSLVQPEVAKFTRVCTYDRAGLAWSDATAHPRTADRFVSELHTLLAIAQVPGPYVLVGHSFGGILVRYYASKYPNEVAGMVLVDTLPISEWLGMTRQQKRVLRGGIFLSRVGSLLARVGVVRACLALLSGGAPGVPRAFIKIFGPSAVEVLGRIVGEVQKLPADKLPVVQALWCQPKCFTGMARHLASLPSVSAQVSSTSMADVPLVVLSAGTHRPERLSEDEALSRLSTQGTHIVARTSGHWIHLDEPDLVVEAIRGIVETVRVGSEPSET